MMRGQIWVDSEVGAGSTFHFTIPVRMQQRAGLPRPVTAVRLTDLRVLVVDDNVTNRRILTAQLENWQMRPVAVRDAPSALAVLGEAEAAGNPYAVVLVDVQMPGTDGFSLIAQIREHPALARTKAIVLTSSPQSGDRSRCRKLDVAGYLTKPVMAAELLAAIEASIDTRTTRPVSATVGSMPPAAAGLARVLVVEDKPANRALVVHLLTKRGYAVVTANDGRQALDALERERFDLVLMDVQMPEMNGLEATAAIRARESATGAHVPIVALTAHAMLHDRERCLEAGMDAYVTKPIEAARLLAAIERFVPATAAQASGAGDPSVVLGLSGLVTSESRRILVALRRVVADPGARSLERAARRLTGSLGTMAAAATAHAGRRLEALTRAVEGARDGGDAPR
jgi:CheY-like chemotaxis protein